jgi:hypothetical protein
VRNYPRSVVVSLMVMTGGGAFIGWSSAQSREPVRERIVGAWRLETRTVRDAKGSVILDPVLGKAPIGRLHYDASGEMMLQMMRQDRKQPISVPAKPEDAKNPRIVLGYDAYFGTFEVNESAGTITHHVEGSLFPEDLGDDFTRKFTLDGDRFTLEFTSPSPQGGITRTLVFRRVR